MVPATSSTSPPPGQQAGAGPRTHPAVFVLSWMFFSNVTILFNKYLLDTAGFPITLTAIHLATATLFTQLLARYTALIPRPHVPVTGRLYLRTILPIGLLYTLSLVCANLVYLTLSVAFIQMLKAVAPVTTLLLSWAAGLSRPRLATLVNILVIAAGVFLSAVGEGRFAWSGFVTHMVGTVAESARLLLIQALLKGGGGGGCGSDDDKDEEEGDQAATRRRQQQQRGSSSSIAGLSPLVGLYYFAPACALLNGLVALLVEMPWFDAADLYRVGVGTLALNSVVAFMLNVAGVFLIGRTSALVMNLTGILKSIILVVVSAAIWATPVTWMQLVGYGIALAGMFYYSLPPEGLAAAGPGPQMLDTARAWAGAVWAACSDSPVVGAIKSPRLFQSVRRYFAATTRYETVPAHGDDEEGQRKAAAATATTTTTRQGEPKDAVA